MKKTTVDFTFLYKKYPGKWVALANDEKTVLGSGKTAKEALKNIPKKKADTILYRVPKKITLSISICKAAK